MNRQGLKFTEPKTTLSKRTINLLQQVVKELGKHKAHQNEEKLKALAYEYNDLVFCCEDEKPIDPRNFTINFEGLLSKAAITGIKFHDLRHTFTTISLDQVVSIRAIQEILWHYSPAFTMAQYSHVTSKMKEDASDKIGNILNNCIYNDTIKEQKTNYL